jgi:hypothetical protein
LGPSDLLIKIPPRPAPPASTEVATSRPDGGAVGDDEASLIDDFDITGAEAQELLGYDDNDDEDEDEDDDEDDEAKDEEELQYRTFQTSVRVDAAKRAEGNRRAGGLKTQRAMRRKWEVKSTPVFLELSTADMCS